MLLLCFKPSQREASPAPSLQLQAMTACLVHLHWLRGVCITCAQVSKYVEREILNHKRLIHPHIVQLKEVRTGAPLQLDISTVASILGVLLSRCGSVNRSSSRSITWQLPWNMRQAAISISWLP